MANTALTVADLYRNLSGQDDGVSYINYWAEPDKTLVDEYIEKHSIWTKCAKECQVCQITHINKYQNLYPNTPRESIKAHKRSNGAKDYSHPWQISCSFIPEDYDSLIPSRLLESAKPEELSLIRGVNDPVAFGSHYFSWRARKHQALMLRCQAKRKVLRWGRRSGKTEANVIETIWHAVTKNITQYNEETKREITLGYKVLVVAPFESQVINFFQMIDGFLDRSPELSDAVVARRKSPHHHLEFKNGATIKGFTTGSNEAASLRGQDADLIVLDEADYLSEGDYRTIIPIAQSKADVLMRVCSTPKGKRERFYNWSVNNPQWKEFYFPSAVIQESPESGIVWEQMRREMRPEYSHDEWLQEVMAIFIANQSGVYQPAFVTNAMKDYTYSQMTDAMAKVDPGIVYMKKSIGVDWNSNVGTEICVLGWSAQTGFKVLDMVNVPKQDFTQHKGLTILTKLITFWKPEYVYVDAGHGSSNHEILRLWCQSQPPNSYERSMEQNIKKFEFGGKVEIRDPASQQLVKHPAKAFMVENSVRKFEDGVISFSKDDDKLRKQLLNYIVKSRSESGKPIYDVESPSIGDHALDALNLALVAFLLEESLMAPQSRNPMTTVGVLGSPAHVALAKQTEPESSMVFEYDRKRALFANLSNRFEAVEKRSKDIAGKEQSMDKTQYTPHIFDSSIFLSDREHLYEGKSNSIRNVRMNANKGIRNRGL